MDPISISLIGGGLVTLYSGYLGYSYYYSTPEESEDVITNEDIKKIEKVEKVVNKVQEIKEEYDLDFEDVIIELENLFKYQQNQSNETSEDTSEESAELYFDSEEYDESE